MVCENHCSLLKVSITAHLESATQRPCFLICTALQDLGDSARSKTESNFAPLANLVKEISHANDPQLKEAGKGRKKALKALLKALQHPQTSQEERQQLLLKNLISQVCVEGQAPALMSLGRK